ncbi:MAG: DUF3489 domain-containing protein [Paracoccus sp. (in: a-proteobacteria)]|nr:DUF3489 domain-containing protein [Paracoccus sp. (in: a-proteobacteria)]
MHDLTPTQTAVLNAASTRPSQIALPLPGNLPAGAQAKVVAALLTRGLLAEAEATPGDPLWRDTGRTLALTPEGMVVIGFDPVVIRAVAAKGVKPKASEAAVKAADGAEVALADQPRSPRTGTKQATLIAMLRAPEGASIAEIASATDWQPHTVRGAISGALKKRLGLEVVSEKHPERGRVYRVVA